MRRETEGPSRDDRIRVVVLHDRPKLALGLVETLTFVELLPLFAMNGDHADLLMACDVDGQLTISAGTAKLSLADPHGTLLRRWRCDQQSDIQVALTVRELMQKAGLSRTISWGPLTIRPRLFEATMYGRRLSLSPLQLRLLTLLTAAGGEVVTRQQIAARVFGDSFDRSGDRLDAHVRRLRQLLEVDPAHPRFLLTVRGEGLRLANLDEAGGSSPSRLAVAHPSTTRSRTGNGHAVDR